MRWGYCLVVVLLMACSSSDDHFQSISKKSKNLGKYFENKDHYELQIIYTQINRDEHNNPSLKSYKFNYDSTHYFYPASTVKMPVAFLALQKLQELGIDKWDVMKTDSARVPQTRAHTDTTSVSGLPSVAHYIEKIFAVSDNDAYNRLYEFLGQDYINRSLREKKVFTNSRVVTRVGISGFSTADNRYTNPVSFYDKDNKEIYAQAETQAAGDYLESLQPVSYTHLTLPTTPYV